MSKSSSAQQKLTQIFKKAGVEVNGPGPADIQIKDEATYAKFMSGGTLAIGELFMDGHWDVEDLDDLVYHITTVDIFKEIVSFDALPLIIKGVFGNLQSRARSFMVGEQHYDLGNDLDQAMLDDGMSYTSAVWRDAETLEEAQTNKLEMICQKLDLKKGNRVLDIGCGWGSFMKHAVEKHGAACVGLTVSAGQTELGREMCEGLPIEFVIKDYRDFQDAEKFDHIVSIEMIEAVGPKNFRGFFEKAHELLKPSGRFALQAIGSLKPKPVPDRWIDRYIFPNGVMPSLPQLEEATRGLFIMEHLENIGLDYDRTLMEWWRRFDAAYPELSKNNPKYDERFYRMWKFYLQSCAGLFRSRVNQDWQIIFSPIHKSAG